MTLLNELSVTVTPEPFLKAPIGRGPHHLGLLPGGLAYGVSDEERLLPS